MKYSGPPPTIQLLFDGAAVAELSKVPQGNYFFKYLTEFRRLNLAPLPGFPDLDRIYEAQEIFPFFQERIPDTRRPEIREWIKQHGLSEDDKLSLLAALGRKAVTDSYELRFIKAA
jgi:HipA-like protein